MEGGDEWCTCCYCETLMCESCMGELTCTGCEEASERGELVIGVEMCESCCEFCETCGDEDAPVAYCTGCMKEHREKCTGKTHAQRVMATVDNEIKDAERQLEQTRAQAADAQRRVSACEAKLAKMQQKKVAAKTELARPDDQAQALPALHREHA